VREGRFEEPQHAVEVIRGNQRNVLELHGARQEIEP
jgi:hypothetical protein